MVHQKNRLLAVIRVRGSINVKKDIKDTLRILTLTRVNHCVILPLSNDYPGMLRKIKDYVTWGELDFNTLEMLLKKRARIQGNIPLTEKWLKANTKYSSFKELAGNLIEGELRYNQLKNLKPLFRLKPPRKGYEGIKRAYKAGGSLGYRGKAINELIIRML